ncbi:double-strand break repair protein AddB [Polymorphobacter sp. PAMC 29334]|uniref:double-strand break repair protein AddB n=1 Tax=Polymorphobacter sp. PAMC 29334 TaxID=2862331 RepID=UPI001C7714C4|nr:double-strand break repair protein AddB [Polymorphobacter sp. PAMC 29334]QYE34951.1 double-strand break repair protein AddB [Polymorphobacter sp. PAMC 29334]
MPTVNVFTIPPHVAFVDALAAGLLERTAGDPMALARAQVLLPNRRAVRALGDAFVRLSGGGLLLPRMTPIGDVDADEALGHFDGDLAADADLPPAIDPTKRRLLLAQLVRRWRDGTSPITAIEALRLADQLAAAFDALAFEEIDPAALTGFAPDDMAHHWEATLAFFRVVLDLWPPLLASHGEIDPATRNRALLDALAARWKAAPPGLVVAAGMAGVAPPVARLLRVIARLPQGIVVLPGLDTAMSDDAWGAIRCHLTDSDADGAADPARNSEEHPQFALKMLLHHLDIARGEVDDWGHATALDGPAGRAVEVARAMAPAAFTGDWRHTSVDAALFENVRAVIAATPAEEAQVIALALRRTLDTPGKTAALVTPDRGLARRVAAHVARWGIEVDDSAGTPLRVTPPGALLLALVEAAARGFTPVALLAVLKHPLVRRGDARLGWLDAVRRLDLALRGVRPAPGLDGTGAQVDAEDARLSPWWAEVAALLDPLERLFATPLVGFAELVATLREAAQALCDDDLWARPEGRALARLVEALETHGHHLNPFEPLDAPALIAAFLLETAVRQPFGKHPRLAIYGTLEARLQRADLMILGGMNEGIWPVRPVPDPWLAPKLRSHLTLPSLERRIGLAAHDFVSALGGPEVLLTRARRDEAAPAVPSRFWLRLHALAGAAIRPDDELLGLARALDAAPPVSATRPAPAPPAALRPRRISVTAAERLKADPYSYYAQTMLRLRALDALDADASAADRGTAVHSILEEWVKRGAADPATLPRFTEAELLKWSGHPLMRALWAPRVRRAMDWVATTMAAWEAEGWSPAAAEADGSIDLANGVTLRGKADRVDRSDTGALAIVDYKTGVVPSHAQVAGGFALQMGLLGWLAEEGRLAGVDKGPVGAMRYWKLGGGTDPGKASDPLKFRSEVTMAVDHIAATKAHFHKLCDDMLLGEGAFTAKLHPEYAKGNDYDQLARVLEWLGRPKMADVA